MTDRDRILQALRAARQPFGQAAPITDWRPVVPLADTSPAALLARFVQAAGDLGCVVTRAGPEQAIESVLASIAPDTAILSWDLAHIPLPGLADALSRAGIRVVRGDAAVRVGLTGADAALAATGSLVLAAGPGKPRQPSLLPPVHIAILTPDRIVPSFDAWAAAQRGDGFQRVREPSSIVVISGPSRTGDIANIPVRGVHGPRAVQILLLESPR